MGQYCHDRIGRNLVDSQYRNGSQSDFIVFRQLIPVKKRGRKAPVLCFSLSTGNRFSSRFQVGKGFAQTVDDAFFADAQPCAGVVFLLIRFA